MRAVCTGKVLVCSQLKCLGKSYEKYFTKSRQKVHNVGRPKLASKMSVKLLWLVCTVSNRVLPSLFVTNAQNLDKRISKDEAAAVIQQYFSHPP